MRILLTGASGFLGAHTARALVEVGHELRALVRPTSNRSWLEGVELELAIGDLSGAGLASACAEMDAVVHLAGLTQAQSETQFLRVNGEGTGLLAQAAATAGVSRFVYVSSLAAHGPAGSQDREPRDPAAPAHPVSPYGRSKAAGEIAALAQAGAMAVQVLRPSVVYGPYDNGLLPFFKMARWRLIPVMGRGENSLSFIHARDFAESVGALLAVEPQASPYFHVAGPGPAYSWRELVDELARSLDQSVMSVPLPAVGFLGAALLSEAAARLLKTPPALDRGKVREMEQHAWVCDHAALTAATGWTPHHYFPAGLRETVDWYRVHGWI